MDSELDIAQVLHAEAHDVYLKAVVAKFRGCLDEWKRLMREAAALDCAAAGCAEDAADPPLANTVSSARCAEVPCLRLPPRGPRVDHHSSGREPTRVDLRATPLPPRCDVGP